MPEIIRLAAAGVFNPSAMVTRRFPLAEADDAYQALARGEIVGRAIVMPWEKQFEFSSSEFELGLGTAVRRVSGF